MKQISYEQFIKDLDSKNGRLYIKTVNNPKYQANKDEEGEYHHIHPVSLGGDDSTKVRLTIFGHCLAHLYLAKAAMEKHTSWVGEALCAINFLSNVEFHHLSELEKVTLKDVHNWEILRMAAKEISISKRQAGYYNKLDDIKKIISVKNHNVRVNLTEEERLSWNTNNSIAQKSVWDSRTNEYKKDWGNKKREDNTDRVCMNNGFKEKRPRPEQVEYYKSLGYVIGRLNNPQKNINIGRIKIINDNEPKSKKIFPADLPYWESLGWYRVKKVA